MKPDSNDQVAAVRDALIHGFAVKTCHVYHVFVDGRSTRVQIDMLR